MLIERQNIQSQHEIEDTDNLEMSPTFHISDEEMIDILSCPGFGDQFDMNTLTLSLDACEQLNNETKAMQVVTEGTIKSKKGELFKVISTRDLDNRGIKVAGILKACAKLKMQSDGI